jgi:rubrerythrin
MIDENFLIRDEKDAIAGYEKYLAQGVRNPKIIPIINGIIRDERKHIRLLNKVEKMRAK